MAGDSKLTKRNHVKVRLRPKMISTKHHGVKASSSFVVAQQVFNVPELTEHISKFADPLDVFSGLRFNTFIRNVIKGSPNLRRKLFLEVEEEVDGMPSTNTARVALVQRTKYNPLLEHSDYFVRVGECESGVDLCLPDEWLIRGIRVLQVTQYAMDPPSQSDMTFVDLTLDDPDFDAEKLIPSATATVRPFLTSTFLTDPATTPIQFTIAWHISLAMLPALRMFPSEDDKARSRGWFIEPTEWTCGGEVDGHDGPEPFVVLCQNQFSSFSIGVCAKLRLAAVARIGDLVEVAHALVTFVPHDVVHEARIVGDHNKVLKNRSLRGTSHVSLEAMMGEFYVPGTLRWVAE